MNQIVHGIFVTEKDSSNASGVTNVLSVVFLSLKGGVQWKTILYPKLVLS